MVDNDCFYEFVDVGLARHLVVAFRDRHQGGTKTDGQVIGVHHVLLTVVRQAVQRAKGEWSSGCLMYKTAILSFISYITSSCVCQMAPSQTVNNTQDESLNFNVVVMKIAGVCVFRCEKIQEHCKSLCHKKKLLFCLQKLCLGLDHLVYWEVLNFRSSTSRFFMYCISFSFLVSI